MNKYKVVSLQEFIEFVQGKTVSETHNGIDLQSSKYRSSFDTIDKVCFSDGSSALIQGGIEMGYYGEIEERILAYYIPR